MYFEHLDKSNNYLNAVLSIIRKGINTCIQNSRIDKTFHEDNITQNLCQEFNFIGMELKEQKIACFPQNKRKDSSCSEDIHFFLQDDNKTDIFFAEAKCLPKPNTPKNNKKFENEKNEYVNGVHSGSKFESPSGGIQRYKLAKHGYKSMRNNAILAYIKNYTIDEWFNKINSDLTTLYPDDSILSEKVGLHLEYISKHKYKESEEEFTMHHFWIDLTS